jgi:hypothetical protein
MNEWPTCSAEGSGIVWMRVLAGAHPVQSVELVCELPEHHEMDGDEWHQDPSGCKWRELVGDE